MNKRSRLGIFFIISASIFFFAWFVIGDVFGWMYNSQCFRYLGCNVGFFGYDAVVHFLGGIMEATGILWLAEKFPKLNFFHKSFLKNCIILVTIVVLLGVCWEIFEFTFDHVRMDILHVDLLHPTNRLTQASNSDTMGDLTFDMLGALGVAAILGLSDRRYPMDEF